MPHPRRSLSRGVVEPLSDHGATESHRMAADLLGAPRRLATSCSEAGTTQARESPGNRVCEGSDVVGCEDVVTCATIKISLGTRSVGPEYFIARRSPSQSRCPRTREDRVKDQLVADSLRPAGVRLATFRAVAPSCPALRVGRGLAWAILAFRPPQAERLARCLVSSRPRCRRLKKTADAEEGIALAVEMVSPGPSPRSRRHSIDRCRSRPLARRRAVCSHDRSEGFEP